MAHEHTCESGLKLVIDSQDQEVINHLVAYYEKEKHSLPWECPFCQSDIDAVCDEGCGIHDDSDEADESGMYEDTYDCLGDCEVMITYVTPCGIEYYDVSLSEATIEIEFMVGDRPADWDEDEHEDAEDHPENYHDDTIPPNAGPMQTTLFEDGE